MPKKKPVVVVRKHQYGRRPRKQVVNLARFANSEPQDSPQHTIYPPPMTEQVPEANVFGCEPDTSQAPSRYYKYKARQQHNWAKIRELLRKGLLESNFPSSSVCIKCGVDSPVVIQCQDCGPNFVECESCAELSHYHRPLHLRKIWNVRLKRMANVKNDFIHVLSHL